MSEKITLQTLDARNFAAGDPVLLFPDPERPGGWRTGTRWERLRVAIGDRWYSWTRWWRLRRVIAEVDVSTGSITVAAERWSWRRWRWERVA